MRKEYDLSKLEGGVPDSEAVNRALRVLAEAAQTASAPKRRRSR